jgi:predicted lipoprotein with Yx(FWY)xxD motif
MSTTKSGGFNVIATRLAVVVAGLAVGAVACGSSSSGGNPSSVGAGNGGASGAGTAAKVSVQVHHSAKFGKYLTTGQGRTLYVYTPDSNGTSNCNGACANDWPPYVVPGGSALAQSSMSGLSEITRSDGTKQVALNGHPLYNYSDDDAAGQFKGQGEDHTWYVATPTGFSKAGVAAASSDSSSSSSGSSSSTSTPPTAGGGYGY